MSDSPLVNFDPNHSRLYNPISRSGHWSFCEKNQRSLLFTVIGSRSNSSTILRLELPKALGKALTGSQPLKEA